MKLLIGMTQDGWFFNRSITSLLNWISWGLPTGLLERRSQGSNTYLGRKQEHAKDIKHDCSSRKRNNQPLRSLCELNEDSAQDQTAMSLPHCWTRVLFNRITQLLYRLANAFPLLLAKVKHTSTQWELKRVVVWQRLTQHCEASFLQLKIN